jgi:hypothetical protein
MIDADTYEPLPNGNFYTQDAHNARVQGIAGNPQALQAYEAWFNHIATVLPGVHHYSWFDIARKMRLYRNYWTAHWVALSGKEYVDTAENNMFFDVLWSEVTDDMIIDRAKQLAEETGGHIFHKKWKGEKTPSIHIHRSQPKIMLK